ncbi:MAG: hypothetical protein L6R41_001169 [Letrouitia leprolyta]|nr:MAG: hypothetical protein L6R41_001169 [Letrouitia leprolyta]
MPSDYPSSPSVSQSNPDQESHHQAPNPPDEPTLKIPNDPQWVTARLRTYRLFQNDREAFAKYPDFEKQVNDILDRERSSSVDPGEFQDFQLAWNEYKDKNEDTVLNKLLPFFVKEKRTVKVEGMGRDEDVYAVVPFLKSGLVEISNREFSRTCLPFQQDGSSIDKTLVSAMAKENGMTNPKPDRTFGISMSKHWFPDEGFPVPPEIAIWLETIRGMHHPFFVVEGKSFQGNLLDSWNQANRACATIGSMLRRILTTLGWPDVVGADTRTFVFSATLSPNVMNIWVHWVEVPGPNAMPNYHMTKLVSKALDEEENFGPLRKMLHNILDWGCGPRFETLKPLYAGIVTYKEKKAKQAEQQALAAKAKAQHEKAEKEKEKTNKKRARLSVGSSLGGEGRPPP